MTTSVAYTRDTDRFLLPAIQYLGEGFFMRRLFRGLIRSDDPIPSRREARLDTYHTDLSYLVHVGKARDL
ncbi:hypothetical protein ACS3QZ_01595 [Shimia sp. W99]